MPRPARYQQREGRVANPSVDANRTTLIDKDLAASMPLEGRGGEPNSPSHNADVDENIGKQRKRGTITIDRSAYSRADVYEGEGDDNHVSLDENRQSRQSSFAEPGEAEVSVAESVARRMGWVPKDEWKRNPDDWMPATEFLERTPEQVSKLQERARRAGQIADEAARLAREQGRIEAQAQLDAAVEAGDKEAARRAGEKLAAAVGPDPKALAWADRNPWFRSDPTAAAVAQAAAERAMRSGASVDEQLEAAEREVKRRFPEHFSGRPEIDARNDRDAFQDRSGREVRLSEVPRNRPSLEGGTRNNGGQQRPRVKGWSDIPASVRDQMAGQIRKFESVGLTREQAQARIGGAYWREKGDS